MRYLVDAAIGFSLATETGYLTAEIASLEAVPCAARPNSVGRCFMLGRQERGNLVPGQRRRGLDYCHYSHEL